MLILTDYFGIPPHQAGDALLDGDVHTPPPVWVDNRDPNPSLHPVGLSHILPRSCTGWASIRTSAKVFPWLCRPNCPEGNLSHLQESARSMLTPRRAVARPSMARPQDMEAAHAVTSHLRLVAKIAMGYRGYGLPVGELISEVNVGMCTVAGGSIPTVVPPGDLRDVVDLRGDPGIHPA